MKILLRRCSLLLILCLALAPLAVASAYDSNPKLVVVIIIDQFRGDYLERIHSQLGQGGFRLFTDKGADFVNCAYEYANTETAPGHATLFTGTYSNGHGIFANEVWDEKNNTWVTAVSDPSTRVVGVPGGAASASPHNLLTDTIGDELKLATHGRAHVYTISLKDRASVLPAGFSADGAFWIDPASGAWITSTFYMKELPKWAQDYNAAGHADKLWNQDWKDATGNVLQHTTRTPNARFYDVIGGTGLANEYELDFAQELITNTNLGTGPATDLLIVSLSANDILGHRVGPDSLQMQGMWLDLDRQLANFFSFLGQRYGLANVWLALSADHGVAPVPELAREKERIEAGRIDTRSVIAKLNAAISARLRHANAEFVHAGDYDFAHLFLTRELFANANFSEAESEHIVGEEALKLGFSAYYTKVQLRDGAVATDQVGRRFLHSYTPENGWWVLAEAPAFVMPGKSGTSHGSPYYYDRHVPLAFFGLPFEPGVYRDHCEPVDMVPTLSSLLGINAPAKASGHVLTEALRKRSEQ
ncbi:MAG: alkaline phosphatase family protein [Terriglobales bacterium]